MAGINIIKPLMIVGLASLLTRTPSLSRRELLATPLDWLMVTYALYLVYSSPDFFAGLMEVIPLFSFYYVTTLALTDQARLSRYLHWWLACLAVIATLGVLTQFGFDITGAKDKINQMIGRLLLNTWLLNNPNALGHTVVIAMPMAYLLLWWKRPFLVKVCAVGLIVTAYYCTVYTESKGAFLVAAGGLVVAVTFGRPAIFQIIVVVIVLSIGTGGLMFLPRMKQMNNLSADEGVQGRLMAWEIAQTSYQTKLTGQGWKQFHAVIEWEGELYGKATHSTFVKVGADLGPIGLFLFLTLLCVAARVVMQYPGTDETSERCRRVIFLLLAMFFASGWMIDHAYHTEFFLLLAIASAYMRFSISARTAELSPTEQPTEASVETAQSTMLWPNPAPDPAFAGVSTAMMDSNTETDAIPISNPSIPSAGKTTYDDDSAPKKKLWQRLSVLDLVIGYVALHFIVWLWTYILKTML